MIRVVVCGVAGNMGKQVARGVLADGGLVLVGGVDPARAGHPLGEVLASDAAQPAVEQSLNAVQEPYDVVVDFTRAETALANAQVAAERGADLVIGTTGFTGEQLDRLRALASRHQRAILVAPNFSVGALLLTRWVAEAARHFQSREIIEAHRAEKLDAPSGTALRLAQAVSGLAQPDREPGAALARGELVGKVPVHSLRMTGYVARHDVWFAGPGERLVLSHEVTDRQAFVPGVLAAIHTIRGKQGFFFGLDELV